MALTTGDETRELWNPKAQTLDPGALAETMTAGLAAEWARVWDTPIPFYRAKYEAAGLGPDEVPPLDQIPRTTKDELRQDQADHPPFGTHRAVTLEDAARLAVTTGTTGKPWMIFYTKRDLDLMTTLQLQHTWRIGLRPGHHFTHAWPGGLYPTAVLGGRHFLEQDILEIPVGPPFNAEQAAGHVELWQTLGIDALMCTGSQLQIYEEAAAGARLDLAEILDGASLVFLEASCQFEVPRKRVEDAYGVRLHNIGGAAEVPGLVASDCRFHTGLHVSGTHHMIEACDPETGRRVEPGERGTLVASMWGLDNFVLRYDLEDIVVERTDPCPCEQTGSRYTLLGRAADRAMVGEHMILPLDVQLALEELGAPEFVLAPGETDRLRIKIEADGDRGYADAVAKTLGCPVEVEPVEVGSLPRSTFKPRRVAA